jgi:anoctamin-10
MARLQGARNNTYAIHYDFSDIDADEAIVEFTELCSDLTQAGLSFEVRPGDDESLLVFARAPKNLLRAAVYDLRWVSETSCRHASAH